jgi:hypothetical protein
VTMNHVATSAAAARAITIAKLIRFHIARPPGRGRRANTVITAAPGFNLLRFWFYDAEPNVSDIMDSVCREPIIASRLKPHWLKPIGPQIDPLVLPGSVHDLHELHDFQLGSRPSERKKVHQDR